MKLNTRQHMLPIYTAHHGSLRPFIAEAPDEASESKRICTAHHARSGVGRITGGSRMGWANAVAHTRLEAGRIRSKITFCNSDCLLLRSCDVTVVYGEESFGGETCR